MGGVQFFEVSLCRMLTPTCIQKCIEKRSILRPEIVPDRLKLMFIFHARFEVFFSSIFEGSRVHSGVLLGVLGGAFWSQESVKKGGCYEIPIRGRLEVDFGSILGGFWGRFGDVFGCMNVLPAHTMCSVASIKLHVASTLESVCVCV